MIINEDAFEGIEPVLKIIEGCFKDEEKRISVSEILQKCKDLTINIKDFKILN